MEILKAERVGQQYTFYPCGPDRSTSFVIVPREMVDEEGMEKVQGNWTRMVAFGDLAVAIDKLVQDGVNIFKVGKGRIRNNNLKLENGSILKAKEVVASTLDMKGFDKLMNSKAIKGTGEYSGDPLPDAS